MARFENGWIKIHRSILANAVAQRDVFTLGVFLRLLCMAHWRESNGILSRQKITVKPGQVVTSLRELSPDKEEDPYLHRVRNALAYLQMCETIAQTTSNHGRLITICNWEKYQAPDDDDSNLCAIEAQAARKQRANGAQQSEEGKKRRRNSKRAPSDKELEPIKEFSDHARLVEILKTRQVRTKTQQAWLDAYRNPGWIKTEIFKALCWEESAQDHKPNFAKFITNWLGRAVKPAQSGAINTTPIQLNLGESA